VDEKIWMKDDYSAEGRRFNLRKSKDREERKTASIGQDYAKEKGSSAPFGRKRGELKGEFEKA